MGLDFQSRWEGQRKIEETESEHPCLQMIKNEQKTLIHTKKPKGPDENFPEPTISKGVLEALGKRGWELEKLKTNTEQFFQIDTSSFEDKELLSMRKDMGLV